MTYKDKVIKLYKEKNTIRDISKAMGISRMTVYNWLKEDGIELTGYNPAQLKPKYTPEMMLEWIRYVREKRDVVFILDRIKSDCNCKDVTAWKYLSIALRS